MTEATPRIVTLYFLCPKCNTSGNMIYIPPDMAILDQCPQCGAHELLFEPNCYTCEELKDRFCNVVCTNFNGYRQQKMGQVMSKEKYDAICLRLNQYRRQCKVITEKMTTSYVGELCAEQWGIDVECVNCKVYDENTEHPGLLSACDGCYESKTHPNFKAKVN